MSNEGESHHHASHHHREHHESRHEGGKHHHDQGHHAHHHEHRHGGDCDEDRLYRFKIDRTEHDSPLPDLTGRDLLIIAGKHPPERFKLLRKVGATMTPVGLDEVVHLGAAEERFITLPLDQTEGEAAPPHRRDFALPEDDADALDASGVHWETVREGDVARVVLRGFPVREGYAPRTTDLMLRLPTGYPTVQIDMFYFHPPLVRADGITIRSLVRDTFEQKAWQGWSRHRTGTNPWRPDIDGVATHLALVEHCLALELGAA